MRLFVAIEVDEQIASALTAIQQRLERPFPALRMCLPQALHLTLQFLGEVDETRLPAVVGALSGVAAGRASFEISPGEITAFPYRGTPAVVCCALNGETAALENLRAAVFDVMAECGCRQENRNFTPHITLARLRRGTRASGLREALSELAPAQSSQTVRHFSLIQSTLLPSGSQYSTLHRFNLER